MSEAASYFVRSRGRVSGPFDLSGLQKMVRRGLVSRIHEISSDRVQWTSAGEFEDLFPTRATQGAVAADSEYATSGQEVAPESDSAPTLGSTVSRDANDQKFYYSQSGSVVGPVPLSVMRTLAENGTLRADDMVWRDSDAVAVAAYQITHLAQYFSRQGIGRAYTSHRSDSANHESALEEMQGRVRISSLLIGLFVGGILLIFTNLPLLTSPKVVFWWHAFETNGGSMFALICTLLTLCGIGLLIATPLTYGFGRGIFHISVAAAILTCWLISGLAEQTTVVGGLITFALVLIPVFAALLLAAGRFRGATPNGNSRRGLSGACAIGLTICSLVGGVTLLVTAGDSSGPMPGQAIAILICIVLEIIIGLVAGIMGLIGLKQIFSRELNIAAMVCSLITISVAVIWQSIVIVMLADMGNLASAFSDAFGVRDRVPTTWSVAFLFFRLIVIYYALISLLTGGLNELLLSLRPRATERRFQTR